jgi:hypothetical protein
VAVPSLAAGVIDHAEVGLEGRDWRRARTVDKHYATHLDGAANLLTGFMPVAARRMRRCSSAVNVAGERCGTRTGSLGGGGSQGESNADDGNPALSLPSSMGSPSRLGVRRPSSSCWWPELWCSRLTFVVRSYPEPSAATTCWATLQNALGAGSLHLSVNQRFDQKMKGMNLRVWTL